MASPEQISALINDLSLRTTAAYVGEAQTMLKSGFPAPLAASIVLDAALMAAASFIQSAVLNGAVSLTMPIGDLLQLRLTELLSMPTRFHQQLPDGSFDPIGMSRN
jgi:hypothetical protein